MFSISSSRVRTALFLLALVLPHQKLLANQEAPSANDAKKCLYVSSYHQGYAWSDAIEKSIRETLDGHCELQQIDMDTKRKKSMQHISTVTDNIRETIEEWQPDVVITSDDNAAKHLIAKHYRDDEVPFVFCGVNWTVDEYDFPYSNVTGIVEVAPVKTMLQQAFSISDKGRKALYIGADTLSEKKNYDRIQAVAEELNINIVAMFPSRFKHWQTAMSVSKHYDFVVMGSNAGIDEWDDDQARRTALDLSKRPSVTNHKWMMPYTTFGFTKLPKEQGQWAANVAIRILNGSAPSDVPLASNRKWDLWLNEAILSKLQIRPSRKLLKKAKRLQIASSDD